MCGIDPQRRTIDGVRKCGLKNKQNTDLKSIQLNGKKRKKQWSRRAHVKKSIQNKVNNKEQNLGFHFIFLFTFHFSFHFIFHFISFLTSFHFSDLNIINDAFRISHNNANHISAQLVSQRSKQIGKSERRKRLFIFIFTFVVIRVLVIVFIVVVLVAVVIVVVWLI